jgi:hypothetical protein
MHLHRRLCNQLPCHIIDSSLFLSFRRARPRANLRPWPGVRLQQEEAPRVCGHPRLHGARGSVQGHCLRFVGRLVLLRMHALQTAEGTLSLQAAQGTVYTDRAPPLG